jgi:hypothetical protein
MSSRSAASRWYATHRLPCTVPEPRSGEEVHHAAVPEHPLFHVPPEHPGEHCPRRGHPIAGVYRMTRAGASGGSSTLCRT